MSKTLPTYYSLRYNLNDRLHKRGESELGAADEIHIGQQENCGVRLENNTEYEDELFAIIRPSRNDGEWQLIPASSYVETRVNGLPVELVHYLADGDVISFDGEEQEIVFHLHYDNLYTKGEHHIAAPMSGRLIAMLVTIPIVLFSLLAGYLIHKEKAEQREVKLIEVLRPSVLQISVDSVFYVRVVGNDMTVIDKFSYEEGEGHVKNGTAFVTVDRRIITSRHCIEPWLNDGEIREKNLPGEIKSVPTRWALEAETYNQLHDGDTTYHVVAMCNLSRGRLGTDPFGHSMLSTEFQYCSKRDDIVEKGDFRHEYYWRSITGTYSRKDMMLDDIAWAPTDSTGKIHLATSEEMRSIMSLRQELVFMGYPEHSESNGFAVGKGRVQQMFEEGEMIAHNGDLTHGNSGGPLLVLKDDKAYAVGVISRIDASGRGGRAYSVPITELSKDDK